MDELKATQKQRRGSNNKSTDTMANSEASSADNMYGTKATAAAAAVTTAKRSRASIATTSDDNRRLSLATAQVSFSGALRRHFRRASTGVPYVKATPQTQSHVAAAVSSSCMKQLHGVSAPAATTTSAANQQLTRPTACNNSSDDGDEGNRRSKRRASMPYRKLPPSHAQPFIGCDDEQMPDIISANATSAASRHPARPRFSSSSSSNSNSGGWQGGRLSEKRPGLHVAPAAAPRIRDGGRSSSSSSSSTNRQPPVSQLDSVVGATTTRKFRFDDLVDDEEDMDDENGIAMVAASRPRVLQQRRVTYGGEGEGCSFLPPTRQRTAGGRDPPERCSAYPIPFGWTRRPRGLMYDPAEESEDSGECEEHSNSFLSDLAGEEHDDFGLDLMDLPNQALARVFFSGCLDSLKVVSSLRLVSKRVMAIGRDSCKILDLHSLTLSDKDIRNVTAAFPNILHLDLSYCKGLGNTVGDTLKACSETLITLNLRGVGASDKMVEGLGGLRNLRELDICQSTRADSNNITAAGLKALSSLKQLEKLGLAWNKGVTDEAVERLCEAISGLRELDLALCGKITSRSLKALSQQANLQALSIQACRLMDDAAVEVLTTACPALVSLDLAHLPQLTAKSLNSLRNLTKLRKLDVRCCEQIRSADVAAFKAARPETWVAELRSWWP